MAWYYWAIVFGFLVIAYILLMLKNKRQEKQSREIMEKFKVGDKVITHIGIYGKIKRIYNTTFGKVCVLEIGTLDKIDIELDMRYIAGIDEKTIEPDEPVKEIAEEQPKEQVKESTEDQPKENNSKKNKK